jgi:hypothetical protein
MVLLLFGRTIPDPYFEMVNVHRAPGWFMARILELVGPEK